MEQSMKANEFHMIERVVIFRCLRCWREFHNALGAERHMAEENGKLIAERAIAAARSAK